MRVYAHRGKFYAACEPCGYRSVPFDAPAKANGAATNHRTGSNHRRLVRLASLRRAA
jgi:hypothetical protein